MQKRRECECQLMCPWFISQQVSTHKAARLRAAQAVLFWKSLQIQFAAKAKGFGARGYRPTRRTGRRKEDIYEASEGARGPTHTGSAFHLLRIVQPMGRVICGKALRGES